MKVLFVATDFESPGRGIGQIINTMIRSAAAGGHEVGLLVGYPNATFEQSTEIENKLEHLHLRHYLERGAAAFADHYAGRLRSPRNASIVFKNVATAPHRQFAIDQELIPAGSVLECVDFCVKIPFFYKYIDKGLLAFSQWTLARIVKEYEIDVVVTGAPMQLTKRGLGSTPLVQFVHDAMPLELTENPAGGGSPMRFAKQFGTAAFGADLVLTNSKDTEGKVLRANPAANTAVVYAVVPHHRRAPFESGFTTRNRLAAGHYLLFVSAIETRKNVPRLFDAFLLAYPRIRMPLVVVGAPAHGYDDLLEHHSRIPAEIRSEIILAGYLSEPDKYSLFAGARAVVFPSIYEGLGLPILEAFAYNVPVLTSRRGALPEAGGAAALYVEDPYDTAEIAEQIVRIVTDDTLRDELLTHVPEQLDMFSAKRFDDRFNNALASLTKGAR